MANQDSDERAIIERGVHQEDIDSWRADQDGLYDVPVADGRQTIFIQAGQTIAEATQADDTAVKRRDASVDGSDEAD